MIKYPKALETEFKDQYNHLFSLKNYPVKIDRWGEPYIPGKKGMVTPFANDGQVLCMYTDKPKILSKMIQLPFVTRHQIADQEGYVKFHIRDIGQVETFLGLRKRRRGNIKNLIPHTVETTPFKRQKQENMVAV